MLARLRSTWLAGGGAVLLVLSITGFAAGAALVSSTAPSVVEPDDPAEAPDTTLTFEDVDGDGIDDDCDDVADANPDAASAAFAAADLDHDGTLSTSEAARTSWIGGKNCNHGGVVSQVAHDSDEDTDEPDEAEEPDADDAPTECEATTTPVEEPAPADPAVDAAPNAHGKGVSAVAHSDAVGGKHCNHGGAVSEAAKKDHADKAEAKAAKAAEKAERAAEKAAGKTDKAAAKAGGH